MHFPKKQQNLDIHLQNIVIISSQNYKNNTNNTQSPKDFIQQSPQIINQFTSNSSQNKHQIYQYHHHHLLQTQLISSPPNNTSQQPTPHIQLTKYQIQPNIQLSSQQYKNYQPMVLGHLQQPNLDKITLKSNNQSIDINLENLFQDQNKNFTPRIQKQMIGNDNSKAQILFIQNFSDVNRINELQLKQDSSYQQQYQKKLQQYQKQEQLEQNIINIQHKIQKQVTSIQQTHHTNQNTIIIQPQYQLQVIPKQFECLQSKRQVQPLQIRVEQKKQGIKINLNKFCNCCVLI